MKDESKKADIHCEIHPTVIAQYAAQEARSCFGIIGFGTVSEGITRIFKNDKADLGIDVRIREGKIEIDYHIIVAYGVNIPSLVENLAETSVYHIESFTGMTIEKINVFVEGVRYVE